MGIFSGKKIRWNHFGKKYNLRISEYEWDYSDIFDALMKKIYEERSDFDGTLAYIDIYGRQSIIKDDKSLRDAFTESKGKLKLHTTLPEGAVISAADIAGRSMRSQSVPPVVERQVNGYQTYPGSQSRSPSSLDSAPAHLVSRYSPPRNRSTSPQENQGIVQSPPSTLPPGEKGAQLQPWPVEAPPPPGYYKVTTYPSMYSQNLLYGMPPHNGMLWRFLANPFPFGYGKTWVGPNKYHSFGNFHGFYPGYGGGGRYMHSTSWGPIF
ncbi:unnamed protein product, partial [Mesorhabditis belari]